MPRSSAAGYFTFAILNSKKGMGMRDDRFIILLDIDQVFSVEEIAMVDAGMPEATSVS